MPTMDIKIVRAGDEPPAYPDVARTTIVKPETDVWRVSFLEEGMTSGAPSVALMLRLPDGTNVFAETSLAAWIAATCAARGAFPEAFANGPLAVA